MTPADRFHCALRAALGDRPGGLALDVGAHVGDFAGELLASGCFARVAAFEPNPASIAVLERRAAADRRLSVHPFAIGAREGETDFTVDGDRATGSVLPYGPGYTTKGEVHRLRVEVRSLDAWRKAEGASPEAVTFLKVDTQGNDLAVLEGAGALLASDRPLVRVELIHLPLYEGQADPLAIHQFLAGRGYYLHGLSDIHATPEGRLAFADGLYMPAEREVAFTQSFERLDDGEALRARIAALEKACAERLAAIETLDAEVKRLGARRGWLRRFFPVDGS